MGLNISYLINKLLGVQIKGSDVTLPAQIKGSDVNLPVQLTGSNVKEAAVQNITTAGTQVQLPNIPCREVTVIGRRTNTGYIYAGKNNVSSTVYGVELAAKDSFTFNVSNANEIWLNASVSGEGISYVAI